jgi:hypothetical protein
VLEYLGVNAEARAVFGDEEGLTETQVIHPLLLLLQLLQHALLVLLDLVKRSERRTDVRLLLVGLRVHLRVYLLALLLLLGWEVVALLVLLQ